MDDVDVILNALGASDDGLDAQLDALHVACLTDEGRQRLGRLVARLRRAEGERERCVAICEGLAAGFGWLGPVADVNTKLVHEGMVAGARACAAAIRSVTLQLDALKETGRVIGQVKGQIQTQ